MTRIELKTTQDLEREIQALEERIEALERDPALESVGSRFFALETFAEALVLALPEQRIEIQRVFRRVSARLPEEIRTLQRTDGMTYARFIESFITHLESCRID